jgi:hypothetical protein
MHVQHQIEGRSAELQFESFDKELHTNLPSHCADLLREVFLLRAHVLFQALQLHLDLLLKVFLLHTHVLLQVLYLPLDLLTLLFNLAPHSQATQEECRKGYRWPDRLQVDVGLKLCNVERHVVYARHLRLLW